MRLEDIPGGTFAQIWFLTKGCTWDRAGACTMCDYGHSSYVAEGTMVDSVAAALGSLEGPVSELFVSPSGSMFDPMEVSPAARRHIYTLMQQVPSESVAVETRPETVTDAMVREIVGAFPSRRVAVGLGLESSSDWVLRFCINKVSDRTRFEAAARRVHDQGGHVYANITLGSPFLTEEEAMLDSRTSALWALENGADEVVVFPIHAKPFTLLGWLWQQGRHRPVSLWSLVQMLKSLPPHLLPRVTVSWYREYDNCCPPGAHPTSCARCRDHVLEALDDYRRDPSAATLEPLATLDCSCRPDWFSGATHDRPERIRARVLDEYEVLAREFGLEAWFARERPHLEHAMAETPGAPGIDGIAADGVRGLLEGLTR